MLGYLVDLYDQSSDIVNAYYESEIAYNHIKNMIIFEASLLICAIISLIKSVAKKIIIIHNSN